MIVAARKSGDEPIVFVTGNSNFPALREFPEAESVYQDSGNADGDLWAEFAARLDDVLESAMTYHEVGPDGSIYVVDMLRFRNIDYDDKAETLSAQWEKLAEPLWVG